MTSLEFGVSSFARRSSLDPKPQTPNLRVGFGAGLDDRQDVALKLRHDRLGPGASVPVEARCEAMRAGQVQDHPAAVQRVDLVAAGQHVEGRTADRAERLLRL